MNGCILIHLTLLPEISMFDNDLVRRYLIDNTVFAELRNYGDAVAIDCGSAASVTQALSGTPGDRATGQVFTMVVFQATRSVPLLAFPPFEKNTTIASSSSRLDSRKRHQ